jgi:hypothetical protein
MASIELELKKYVKKKLKELKKNTKNKTYM